MHLLVTGGAGFIGSHLIRQIIDQPDVRHLTNLDCLTYAARPENLADLRHHPKYSFEPIDLRDKAAVLGLFRRHEISHVVNLAAESHVDRSIAGPDPFVQTNVTGTLNLLEACRESWKSGPQMHRFIQVSTDEVYGSAGPDLRFTEESPLNPSSPYSASKAGADLLARAYFRTYHLPVLITRCSNNFGPGQFPEKLIPMALDRLLERKPIPIYSHGLQIRDWLHVRDHCAALQRVLDHGRVGEIYNVGGDNEWTNLDLIGLLCDLIDEARPDLGGNSRRLIQHVADRPGHDLRYAMDSSKIRRELGWSPKEPFRDRLLELAKTAVNQGAGGKR